MTHSAGNQIANYFGVAVPQLQDYMSFEPYAQ